jgi:hypothetical protein
MGTMTDDGAMPRRASGNGSVVGSSITSRGQSGSWLQSKMNVRHIVNQFLLSTEERRDAAAQHTHYGAVHQGRREAACDARLVSAARGVQSAQQGAARALSPILFPIFEKGLVARIFARHRKNVLPQSAG